MGRVKAADPFWCSERCVSGKPSPHKEESDTVMHECNHGRVGHLLPPDSSKVALDVLVGRTSKEVVQAFGFLYPYGVAVVRTITIERENSATIVRHDSGWQAVSDGRYHFPVPAGATPFVTHPGVVKGVVDVRNIRDLTPEQM
jgi:hypothetical protein